MKRGLDWMDLKRFDSARQEFLQAIASEPKNVEARHQIALSYYLEGNSIESINWITETLSLSPGYPKTRKLLADVVAGAEANIRSPNPSPGIQTLTYLLDRRLLGNTSALKNRATALLRVPDQNVAANALQLLRKADLDVDALVLLAKDPDVNVGLRALHTAEQDPNRYVRVLHMLITDQRPEVKLPAAEVLVTKLKDGLGIPVLAAAFHSHLQQQIKLGYSVNESFDIASEEGDRLVHLAQIIPNLHDPAFAGELSELLCVGRIHGYAAAGVLTGITQVGKPAAPYIKSVLTRQAEFVQILNRKNLPDTGIGWRFEELRKILTDIDR